VSECMPTDSGHGDWFNWGTAQAFRNFAGHIALTAGTDVSSLIIGSLPSTRFLLLFATSKLVIADSLTREPPDSPLRVTRRRQSGAGASIDCISTKLRR
jgi:hypothetical protein